MNGIPPYLAISTIWGMFVDTDLTFMVSVNNPQHSACSEFVTSWQLLNGLLEMPTLSFVESGVDEATTQYSFDAAVSTVFTNTAPQY